MSIDTLRTTAIRHPALALVFGYILIRLTDVIGFLAFGSVDDRPLRASLTSWDGGWYSRAARLGWPPSLDTQVEDAPPGQSTWAWPPAYPLLGRLLAASTGASTDADLIGVALVAVSAVSGALAAVVLSRMLRPYVGVGGGIAVALLWASMPASPLLMMAYSEALFCLVAFTALWAAARDQFVVASCVLLAASMVRASTIAFAAAVALAALVAWRQHRLPTPRLAIVIALTGASVVAWPALVAIRFGDPAAFARVHAAWGRSAIPFRDTLAWLVHPDLHGWPEVALTVGLLATAAIAAVVVWRDRRFPLVVRLIGPLSVATLVVTGVAVSGIRLMLPDIAVPIWLRPLVRAVAPALVVTLALLALRWAWIGIYVGGPVDSPPP